eukprot:SAG22_NODE_2769_length_2226_cov_3.118007_2_plen_206_part_00
MEIACLREWTFHQDTQYLEKAVKEVELGKEVILVMDAEKYVPYSKNFLPVILDYHKRVQFKVLMASRVAVAGATHSDPVAQHAGQIAAGTALRRHDHSHRARHRRDQRQSGYLNFQPADPRIADLMLCNADRRMERADSPVRKPRTKKQKEAFAKAQLALAEKRKRKHRGNRVEDRRKSKRSPRSIRETSYGSPMVLSLQMIYKR